MSSGAVVPLPRVGEIVAPDVAGLAAEFPEWEVGVAWITASSGPDHRILWARRDGRWLVGESRAGMALAIKGAQRG
jgi:hypothetical protein